MDGFSQAALSAIEEAAIASQAAAEARKERERDADGYLAIWGDCQLQMAKDTPAPGPFVVLAKAIAARHPDGDNAVRRLGEEYVADLPWIKTGRSNDADLEDHAAKMLVVDALLEAAKNEPDYQRIAGFIVRTRQIWPCPGGFDLSLVRQDLQSLRKADIRARQAERLAKLQVDVLPAESEGESLAAPLAIGDPRAQQCKMELTAEDRAIAVLAKRPDLRSIKAVAEQVGCSRQYLSDPDKCPRFTEAWEAAQKAEMGQLPSGSKTKTGEIEAWE